MSRQGWLALIVVAAGVSSAQADVLMPLGDTVTASGTAASQTYTVSGSNAVTGPITSAVSYDIGNAFNETLSGVAYPSTSADFNGNATGSGGPWNFQDTYFFTTATNATVQTAVISGSLSNVSDLQVRLLEVTSGSAPTAANPWLGAVSGMTLVDSWQTFNLPGGGSFNETLPTGFPASAPGTEYVLQVRGEAVGNQAASYSGTVAFQTVPLPASGWLLLGALGTLGLGVRRRVA